MYVLPRVRVSVAHFPRDIMYSCRLARAWLVVSCYCIYVYRYYRLVLVLLACSFSFCSVCCWSVVPVPLVPCRLALLSVAVAIWCNRAVMRCNRFSVFGGIVLPCALSCDSGAFYKRLLCAVGGALVCCCGVMVGRLAFVLVFALVAGAVLYCPCWREDGAYWLYICRYIFIYCCCWRGLWRVLALMWWCCALVAGGVV